MSTVGRPPGGPPGAEGGGRHPPPLTHLVAVPDHLGPDPVRLPGVRASDVAGTDLAGGAARVEMATPGCWTLLVFATATCDGCVPLVAACADAAGFGLEGSDRAVVVTREPGALDAARLAAWTGPGRPPAACVVSDDAWRAYRVLGPPFYVLVDGDAGEVVSEGVAWSVEQVVAAVERSRTAATARPGTGGG